MRIIGIKPAPGDHESNIKKVDAIPCGCNTNGTKKILIFHVFDVNKIVFNSGTDMSLTSLGNISSGCWFKEKRFYTRETNTA